MALLCATLRRDLRRELSSPRNISWCRLTRQMLATIASKSPTTKSYSDTLNLPKSQFPMKHSRQLELEVEKRTSFDDLYRDEPLLEPKSPFILHDGPPYANGDAHFGHCINKTLKDIILKRQRLTHCSTAHYIPGWDCHGLPIELKAITEEESPNLTPLEIRSRARQLATAAMSRQRTSFSKWYLEGDLNRPYRTYDIEYSLAQLEAFYRLYQSGLIFRDYMPVYWSPSTRTALAEAELQYNAEHISRAAYIKYELVNSHHLGSSTPAYALIWTTTPWTLLANEAIAFNEQLDYSLVTLEPNSSADHYLVATELIPVLQTKLPNITTQRSGLTGADLAQLRYRDPLSGAVRRLLASGHVSLSKGGTGLVHVAPNHGFEDYKLFQQQQGDAAMSYSKSSIVDHLGRLLLPAPFEPLSITTKDNAASVTVLEKILPQSVVFAEDYQHAYPYDWRSGKPVLIRPSSQWFLSIDSVRQQCLDALDTVKMFPEKLRKEFRHQIASRPNWCLSRQRNWGVPIPVFYEAANDPDRIRPVLTETMFRSVLDTFRVDGLDAWWSKTPEELLGQAEKCNLVKGEDIFDIWFDSGCSWLSVLGEHQIADLYSEGIDQIRGWFQSSLITSVALRGVAPYKAVFIHGFALDREGKKMSKSVGNVIDPNDIVEDRLEKYEVAEEEDKNRKSTGKKKSPGTCGLDGLRFWIARNACTHNDVHVDVVDFREDILTTVNRIRNTFRFLLGVLLSQKPDILPAEEYNLMPLMDKYLLVKIAAYRRQTDAAYEALALGTVAEATLRHLLWEVATFYLSRVKDRLYCEPKSSVEYRSACTVLWFAYHTAGYQLGPILPHITLEANEQLRFKRSEVFGDGLDADRLVAERLFPGDGPTTEEDFLAKMALVLKINETLNKWASTRHRLMEYEAKVAAGTEEVVECLQFFQSQPAPSFTSDLAELLQVAAVSYQDGPFEDDLGSNLEGSAVRVKPSTVAVQENEEKESSETPEPEPESEMTAAFEIELVRTRLALCPRCRRHRGVEEGEELCIRCLGAVQ